MVKEIFTSAAIIALLLGSTPSMAQVKYEKESRQQENAVPPLARQFIDSLGLEVKVRWYLEEAFDRTSVEAKFTLDKLKYSIEFDSAGYLEDVEIQKKWSELDESLQQIIIDQFCEDCWKISIKKVQIQYTGDRGVLWSIVKSGEEGAKTYTLRYEIVVRCRTRKNTVLYEYLYSDAGQKLSRSKIVFSNSSNLEY